MAGHAARRSLMLRWWCAALLAQAGIRAVAGDVPDCVEIFAQIAPGMRTTKDQPMCALWIEDRDGRFVRTLWRFGRDLKYYQDLTVWHDLSIPQEAPAEVDAVTGATVIQGDTGHLRLPTRWKGLDLLSGRYVLRVESRKDHAKHYSALRIPLGPQALGHAVADAGYVRSLELRACSPGTAAPAAVEALASIPPASPVQSPSATTDTHEPQTKEHP